jgi:hypothetical protein
MYRRMAPAHQLQPADDPDRRIDPANPRFTNAASFRRATTNPVRVPRARPRLPVASSTGPNCDHRHHLRRARRHRHANSAAQTTALSLARSHFAPSHRGADESIGDGRVARSDGPEPLRPGRRVSGRADTAIRALFLNARSRRLLTAPGGSSGVPLAM